MATSSTYYLNAPSLASSTSVFTDAGLTVLAADGFYSDGVISREQVSGVLLPQQTCPSCATPCGTTINASGGQGIYLLDLDAGSTSADVGAVIVRFDPYGVPDGIRGILGTNTYNKLTSSVDGLHQSTTPSNLTFIGQTGADCGISGSTYPALIEYLYNGTSFVATGGTQSVTVAPGDVSLGASAPGNTLMVIPKLTASPSIINFEVVGPCSGTAWTMSVACPVLLTGFSSSIGAVSSTAVCELTETTTFYNASLADTPGTVGLYDLVFADAYGSTPLATGFYLATGSITGGNDWFEVNASGVVISLGICVIPPVESYNCVDGTCTDPGDGTGEFSTLIACESACVPPPPECLDRRVVFQICNSNSVTDDNFDIYLNDVYIGAVDLSTNAQVGSVFIADLNPLVELGSSDFVCPLTSMVTYHFDPAIVLGANVLEMRNTQNNGNGNFGTVGVRNYLLTGTTLGSPCVIANLNYSGDSGLSFTFNFDYTQCCPDVSYNCVDGTCVDPGDGTGIYATLGACEAACFAESYNCVDGTCTDPGDGTGTYATLEECEAACSPPPTGYEYRLFGYATDTADACGQTGTYVDLGTLTVYAASPTLSGVTLFYNTYPPLATPYINAAIGNGDRILFALASNTAEKWSGVYNNVTGEISSNVDCTP